MFTELSVLYAKYRPEKREQFEQIGLRAILTLQSWSTSSSSGSV